MNFGYFDDTNKEYVITTPQTPLPWINYLGCESFFRLISNTGGGYAFYKDAKLMRLTRYRYNNAPLDSNGHYYYIKDGSTVWNPGWRQQRQRNPRWQKKPQPWMLMNAATVLDIRFTKVLKMNWKPV